MIKYEFGAILLSLLLSLNYVSAETLDMVYNTDICQYDPIKDVDKCKTIYNLCENGFKEEKLSFVFANNKELEFKQNINGLEYELKIKEPNGNCREIEIEATKNPFMNIDNVLCYDNNCHYEYIWWNSSFLFKYPINASTTVGTATKMVLINDTDAVDLGDGKQYVWCNYTVNNTRFIQGYFYYNTSSNYACVNLAETDRVTMEIDQGNGTNYGTLSEDILGWWHLKESSTPSVDSSIYGNNATWVNTPTRTTGQIGFGIDMEIDEELVVSDQAIYDGNTEFTALAWINPDSDALTTEAIITKHASASLGFQLLRGVSTAKKIYAFFAKLGGGNVQFEGTTDVNANNWYLVAMTLNSSLICLWVDGVVDTCQDSTSLIMNPSTGQLDIGARDNGASSFFNGQIDDVMLINRSINAIEMRAMFDNTEGGQDYAPLGEVETFFTENTSYRHFDLELESFLVTDSDYDTIFNGTFNLSLTDVLTIKGSMSLAKVSGVQPSDVSLRLTMNGDVLIDQIIRTLIDDDDRGVATIPIVNKSNLIGENRISIEMKKTGVQAINITNFFIHVDVDRSEDNNNIDRTLVKTDLPFTSTSYVNIANYTFSKIINSSTIIDVSHSFESDTNLITPECYFINFPTGEITRTYRRYLESAGDVGSSGMNHRSEQFTINDNWGLFCRSDISGLIENNLTVYLMSMVDDDSRAINGFQNQTSINGLTGTNNIIISHDYANIASDQLELLITIIMQSASGEQEAEDSPIFTLNKQSGSCSVSTPRSLVNNNDIGTAKIYLNCENLNIGVEETYELIIDVATGETLNILNASLSTYETTEQNLTIGAIPPIVLITNPLNGTNVTDSINIIANIIDLSNIGWNSTIQLLNKDGSLNTTLLSENTKQNTTIIEFNTRSVGNEEYTINWVAENEGGSENDSVIIFISNEPIPGFINASITCDLCDTLPVVTSITCQNSILITNRTRIGITGGATQTFTQIDPKLCNYGCSNWTLMTLGNPGCQEGDFLLALIFIVVLIVLVIVIRGVNL